MTDFSYKWNKKEFDLICLPNSKEIMMNGLRYFVGEKAVWVPEYDEIASWLADNNRKGLLVFGTNGRGKTLICSKVLPAILQYYMKMEYYMIDATDLSEYYKHPIEHHNLLSRDLIIIDDIGVESITNDFGEKRDIFSELVDNAEKNSRLMVITTNLTPEEIGKRYGLRTLDRLKAIVRAIRIDGESLRG